MDIKKIIDSHYRKMKKSKSNSECCRKPDIKIFNGLWTCFNCGVVDRPQLVHGWIEYNQRNVISPKTVYSRDYYVKRKLWNLQHNDMQKFMEAWKFVEDQLKQFSGNRFPKLDFFISKTLECLDIQKEVSYKISPALLKKYEVMWQNIIEHNVQKSVDTHLQPDHQP